MAPGETFALKLRISPSAGYDWEPARPAPDPAVVVRTGERSKADDPDRMGSPGYHFFDYRAEAEGSARVRLRKDCFACGGEERRPRRPAARDPTWSSASP
ncbi:protease inhibitor I42 family protein [Streptomyces albus]|uniref:protease inhibitor I42 family protein n=1 Tax=Streptomyces albus TaxID=1888 RepID=UPI0036FDDFB4